MPGRVRLKVREQHGIGRELGHEGVELRLRLGSEQLREELLLSSSPDPLEGVPLRSDLLSDAAVTFSLDVDPCRSLDLVRRNPKAFGDSDVSHRHRCVPLEGLPARGRQRFLERTLGHRLPDKVLHLDKLFGCRPSVLIA